MEDYIYRYKGNDYKYLGIGKFKNDFDGAWIDAVLYEREGHKYMREVKDFFKKFEDVSSPKPKKQKTVTEIIHDQLGPGLDPDIFLDVIKDDSKNDEDSNRAK